MVLQRRCMPASHGVIAISSVLDAFDPRCWQIVSSLVLTKFAHLYLLSFVDFDGIFGVNPIRRSHVTK